jgi:NADH:ubiquinone oxidoreductase subunit 5 (subunit L)/multisubunit Na+/H+ antiporter MnhA subunit
MRKWDYVMFGISATLVATGVITMIDGHIFGESTNSVASAIGLLGIFIMLFASRKATAQKGRK